MVAGAMKARGIWQVALSVGLVCGCGHLDYDHQSDPLVPASTADAQAPAAEDASSDAEPRDASSDAGPRDAGGDSGDAGNPVAGDAGDAGDVDAAGIKHKVINQIRTINKAIINKAINKTINKKETTLLEDCFLMAHFKLS